MLDFDDIITKELYFDNQKIEDNAEEPFNTLLLWVTAALSSGKSIRYIKKHILAQDVDVDLRQNILTTFKQQQKIIVGSGKGFNLAQESLAGLTFTETIKERKIAIKKRAVKFAARAKELLKTQQGVEDLIRQEVKKYIKDTDSFWKTQTKAAREYSYEEQDKSFDDIRGWMSVAILDNRTSPICAGFHNKFYSIKAYKARPDVPEKPPRHPNCRSILLTVREGINIAEYKGQNLETFMKRNHNVAEDFMGKEKYRMWSQGEAKMDKYIDMKGRRFYTNEEITQRLGMRAL